MGTTTPNMALYKPDSNEAGSSWYDDLNANLDKLDAAVIVLGKQHTASSVTGTTAETTLYSLVIPGGTIKANGLLRIIALWSFTGSTNSKTFKFKLGGTEFYSPSTVTAANISLQSQQIIRNRNSASSQIASGSSTANPGVGFGFFTVAPHIGTVDTSVDQTLIITGQLANAAETITLESVVVEVMR